METDHFLDASGLTCPMPLLKAKQKLNQIAVGETLCVVATDPGSLSEFEAFSRVTAPEMLESLEQEGVYRSVIRTGGSCWVARYGSRMLRPSPVRGEGVACRCRDGFYDKARTASKTS